MKTIDPAPPLLEMRDITKIFGSLRANDGIDLVVGPGDILGLLGENGAGKTTLMNILFGVYHADKGDIRIGGHPVTIRSSADALAHGIGMVHQHFHLASRLTVLENLMAGQPGVWGMLDRTGALGRLDAIAQDFGLRLDPHRRVASLSVGEQQRLEIIKALCRGARLLILDEPTAVLIPSEVEGLFAALRAMSEKGFGIIFISHKLNEVRAIAKRVMVLRHGGVTGHIETPAEAGDGAFARLMCGHEVSPPVKAAVTTGRALLDIENVSTAEHDGMPLQSVSLTVRAGEILGIAGVSGNGQRALADVIAGMIPPRSGRMLIDGKAVARFTPAAIQAMGLGRIPEDRLQSGIISTLSVADCMVLPRVRNRPFSRGGILNRKAIEAFAEDRIRAFDIRCQGSRAKAGTLSGGNLQKVLLARELSFDPLVLLAAQPTRGLDIGASRFVYDRFLELRAQGRGILLIAEDLDELMALSDRIAVMYEGRVVGVLPVAEVTVERLGLLMSGAGQILRAS